MINSNKIVQDIRAAVATWRLRVPTQAKSQTRLQNGSLPGWDYNVSGMSLWLWRQPPPPTKAENLLFALESKTTRGGTLMLPASCACISSSCCCLAADTDTLSNNTHTHTGATHLQIPTKHCSAEFQRSFRIQFGCLFLGSARLLSVLCVACYAAAARGCCEVVRRSFAGSFMVHVQVGARAGAGFEDAPQVVRDHPSRRASEQREDAKML